ncbi:MAG: DNA-binding protein [Planctomycetes bacterium]|nr:DNA-binding protein [Planctomycetota bacterium]
MLDQLRYAPAATKRKQMERAEALVAEIVPDRMYPLEYVIFRVTSFRPEQSSEHVFSGTALLGDLARFVERLSSSLLLPVDAYEPRLALSLEETCDRLGVGKTTIHRYRQHGLVAHTVRDGDGRGSLVFFADAVERFVEQHRASVTRAGHFSRIDAQTKAHMLRRAQRYRERLGWTLQKSARRLAARFGRSEEAVRLLLKKHDAAHPKQAIFQVSGRLDERTRRLIVRAMGHGVSAGEIADHAGRSRHTVYRVWNAFRAARLQSYELPSVVLPTFDLEGAADVLLSPSRVTDEMGFREGALGGDVMTWHADVMQTESPDDERELTAFGALFYLCYEVGRQRAAFADTGKRRGVSAGLLNELETQLLWAGRIKHGLVERYLRPALVVVEQHLGGPLTGRGRSEVIGLHHLMIQTISSAVDTYHPERGQHFTAYMSFQMARALAQVEGLSDASDRASARARRAGGSLILPDAVTLIGSWYVDMDLPRSLREQVVHLEDEQQRLVITGMYGLDGKRPRTHGELAHMSDALPSTVAQVAAAATRAERELRRLRRMKQ